MKLKANFWKIIDLSQDDCWKLKKEDIALNCEPKGKLSVYDNEGMRTNDGLYYIKQDIYGFLVKNLDLDSNLCNLAKRIKKAS